jgi:hypothetical protein
MSKLKKQLLLIITLLCSFFLLVACSENKIADKPENSAVYDQAKVLSKETIQKIDKLNKESDNTDKKLKIGVYIMEDLDGKDLENTTLEITRKWKIGDKDTNNGVLLFLAINDKKSRLEVSDNLTTRLTDIQSKTILENMKPKLRNKDYDGAVLDAIKNITDANNGKTIKEIKDETTGMVIIFVIVVLIGIVILLVIDVGGGFGGDSDGFWFSSDGSSDSSSGGFSGGGFSGGGASSGW